MNFRYTPLALAGYLPTMVSAADAGPATGIAGTGAGTLIIGAACGLLIAMLLRPVVVCGVTLAARCLDDRALRKAMCASGHRALHDFIVPGAYGGLTRIDHAVLTPHGIVCVLYRNYRGLVFGSTEDPQWTCVDGAARQRFLNPVIQNQGHVAALQKALPDQAVAGVVVFGNRVEFQGQRPRSVVLVRELADHLERFRVADHDIDDWDAAWLSLSSAALTDDETRKDFDAQLSFG